MYKKIKDKSGNLHGNSEKEEGFFFLIQSSMDVTKADQCRTTLGHVIIHSKLRRLRLNKAVKFYPDIQYFLSRDLRSLVTVKGRATPHSDRRWQ